MPMKAQYEFIDYGNYDFNSGGPLPRYVFSISRGQAHQKLTVEVVDRISEVLGREPTAPPVGLQDALNLLMKHQQRLALEADQLSAFLNLASEVLEYEALKPSTKDEDEISR